MVPRILLVEDDNNTRIALTYWLQQAGYRVTQASDGKMAFELMDKHTFEVVVTDIMMGDIDGIEVLQAARSKPYCPEVIILTGHGTLDTAIAAVRAGAYDYLQKPCDEDELLNRINKAVQRHQTESQRVQAEQQVMDVAAMLSNIYGENQSSTTSALSKGNIAAQELSAPISVLRVGELIVGSTRFEVVFRGQTIHLTPIEYALLRCLAERPGIPHTYREIVQYTHHIETDDNDAQKLIKQHIFNVRKKIEATYLINDRGMGYMLINPDQTIE